MLGEAHELVDLLETHCVCRAIATQTASFLSIFQLCKHAVLITMATTRFTSLPSLRRQNLLTELYVHPQDEGTPLGHVGPFYTSPADEPPPALASNKHVRMVSL